MHEFSIAKLIIEDAKAYGEVKSLTVEVGDLAHLPALEMKEVMEKHTNWKVKVVSKAAVVSCSCGFTGAPKIVQQLHDNNIYECSKCGLSLPVILDGADIVLKEVEVVDDSDEELNENGLDTGDELDDDDVRNE